jgi:hypothetical protein
VDSASNMRGVSYARIFTKVAHLLEIGLNIYYIYRYKIMTLKITIYRGSICVNYESLQYKRRNKSFKLSDKAAALNFACSLSDPYVGQFDGDLWDWAISNDHKILKEKNLCFA